MSTKQNLGYQYVVGTGAGIMTKTIELSVAAFTDGAGADGVYTWASAVPKHAIGLGSVVETLTTFNVATTVLVGQTSAEDEWTANAATAATTTIGTKIVSIYATAPAVVTTTSAGTVYVTIRHASDFTLVTAGKIRVTLIFLATQPY